MVYVKIIIKMKMFFLPTHCDLRICPEMGDTLLVQWENEKKATEHHIFRNPNAKTAGMTEHHAAHSKLFVGLEHFLFSPIVGMMIQSI